MARAGGRCRRWASEGERWRGAADCDEAPSTLVPLSTPSPLCPGARHGHLYAAHAARPPGGRAAPRGGSGRRRGGRRRRAGGRWWVGGRNASGCGARRGAMRRHWMGRAAAARAADPFLALPTPGSTATDARPHAITSCATPDRTAGKGPACPAPSAAGRRRARKQTGRPTAVRPVALELFYRGDAYSGFSSAGDGVEDGSVEVGAGEGKCLKKRSNIGKAIFQRLYPLLFPGRPLCRPAPLRPGRPGRG